MEAEQRRAAKQQMVALMQTGVPRQEAAMTVGIQTSRATASRLPARGSHPGRSRAARWQTWTSRQGAPKRAVLAWVEMSGNTTGSKQPIAKGTARAVRSAHEH